MEISKEGQEYLALLDPNFAPVLLFVDYNVDDSEYNTDDDYYSIDDEGEELDHASDDSLDEDINEDTEDEEDGKLGEVDDRCEEDNEGSDEDVGTDEVTDNDDQEEDVTVFFYSIAKRQLMSKRVEEFNTHFYWTTPQGWLLMVHPESHKVFLWSPFIDQRINLPFDEDVLCAQKVSQIEVHKLDLSRRIWVKVSTIGNMVFFVHSTDSGVSASLNAEDVVLKRNCIYYVRPKDKGLYIYDIERGTTSVHNPGVDLADYLTPDIMMTPLS
uniref:KIB1-4 beta-propeller domain-containing protein n=1 Tax=Oryza glaberrima TaxID=4538 RepID=I1QNL7_ORYGL